MTSNNYIKENSHIKDEEPFQSNEIYTQYRPIIEDVLLQRKFPISILKKLYVNRHILRKRDKVIDKLYSHHQPEGDRAKEIQRNYDLSHVAFEFLNDFFTLREMSEMERFQVVLGDIGVGKTTLLRYLFYYILTEKEEFLKPEFIIWVDLWQKISDDHANRESGGRELKKEISSQIYSHIYNLYEKNNPKFKFDLWDFLKNYDKPHRFTNEVARIERTPSENKEIEINEILKEISKDYDKDFDFNILRILYLNHLFNDKICLIIDNSDTVPEVLHSQVMNLCLQIASLTNINTICTLRFSTFQLLANNPLRQAEDFIPCHSIVAAPDLSEVIAKRFDFIKDKINNSKLRNCHMAIKKKTIIIDKSEVIDALSSFINTFTINENSTYLRSLSNNDMRRCFLLIDRLIQADKINFDFTKCIKRIIIELKVEQGYIDRGIPLYEILKLHCLNRRRSFISDTNTMIQNLYCCKIKEHGNTMIKYRILQILNTKESPWRLWDFMEFFNKYFGYSDYLIKSAFEKLLESPFKLVHLSNGEPSLRKKIDDRYDQTLTISDAGKYYIEKLSTDFNYIAHMFYDTFKPKRYSRDYKDYNQLSISDRFDVTIFFSEFLHFINIKEFLGNKDTLPLYFTKTNISIPNFIEFRVLNCLKELVLSISPHSYNRLNINKDIVNNVSNLCDSKISGYKQEYKDKFDVQI